MNGNYEWHHIVEQNKVGINGITSEQINNTNNIIRLDKATHIKVTTFYSRPNLELTHVPGLTVRKWMEQLSFDEQYRIGKEILKRLGVYL